MPFLQIAFCVALFALAALSTAVPAGPLDDNSAGLVDVAQGTLYDGWGRAAVKSLSLGGQPRSVSPRENNGIRGCNIL